MGVKNSSSDLLIANCDEFIFYDDLVRQKAARRPAPRKKQAEKAATAAETSEPSKDGEDKKEKAIEMVTETIDALMSERGSEEKVWGSMVKQALKRRSPGFNESYYGFRAFSDLLEEAQKRGLLAIERDEKSGGHIIRRAA